MKSEVIHRDNCRLCHSNKVELVIELAPVPLAEKYTEANQVVEDEKFYPIDLYMCQNCGHVQILDIINANRLWDDYTYHSGQTRGIIEHFKDVSKSLIEKYKPEKNSLVIDVGSNDGSLLRPFKEANYKVLGIDPATEIARKATESGIPTIASLMTLDVAKKVKAEHGGAAIVTAFNVFAHADDMAGMADSIAHMLAPDGVFVFEVQYLVDIIEKALLGTIFHEHMSHHSLRPMVQFLNAHGMEMIDVQRVNIQKGSIIGTAQLKGAKREKSANVDELLKLEDSMKLHEVETIKQFGSKLASMKSEVQNLIKDWRASGAKVAGFGAARSGPTLIAEFGINDIMEYILDDHPQKVGKIAPGEKIPVVPTKELMERKPDFVFILAWIHAKAIIENNQEYLKQGGHFVLLCPTIQVVGIDSTPNLL